MRHTWHTSDPTSLVSLNHPVTYADRLRMRQPGDAAFSLGPHQDGGSVERWMREGYGRGGTYDAVFAGKWDDDADHNNNNKNNTAGSGFDPWDASTRVDAVNDLYDGLGACSAFRMFQGWLSMSAVGPREGTLLVNPLLKLATSYSLLRPFFRPRMTPAAAEQHQQPLQGKERARFLDARNWEFTGGESMTSDIPGATPGYGMEFPKWAWHPHLELDRTMVHAPAVRPGDFVAWHCDSESMSCFILCCCLFADIMSNPHSHFEPQQFTPWTQSTGVKEILVCCTSQYAQQRNLMPNTSRRCAKRGGTAHRAQTSRGARASPSILTGQMRSLCDL